MKVVLKMARLKTKIFDGYVLQLSSDVVDGVALYTVCVESSHSVPMPKLVERTYSPSKAINIFDNWQWQLRNTCRGFV